MKVGIVLPNWIGDVVMATPTLRSLRRHFGPNAHLIGVMRPYVQRVLEGTDWLDQVILYDRRATNRSHRLWGVARQLRAERLDHLVLLPNSVSSAWLGWLSGARQRWGHASFGRTWMLNQRVPMDRHQEPGRLRSTVDHYLMVAAALGCPPEPKRLELATGAADERVAQEIWDRLGLQQAGRIVLLNTGGAFGPAKDWPHEYWIGLAQRIVDHHVAAVLVLCGPKEREAVRAIAIGARRRNVFSMADEDLSLGVAKACIRRADLMVTTDSGPRHIAAAFSIATVSLFGPIDPAIGYNYHADDVMLYANVPCRPCGKPVCPLGHHACMKELTVDQVYRSVKEKLTAVRWRAVS